jgi:hypothetical protein
MGEFWWAGRSVGRGVWGPAAWRWLHTAAAKYPAAPARAERRAMARDLTRFVRNIPCDECALHASQYLAARPPDLSGRESLRLWAWQFHNDVNARLLKARLPFAEYEKLYAEASALAHLGFG